MGCVKMNANLSDRLTHLDFLQLKVPQLIDSKRFKGSVEEGDGMQPLQCRGNTLPIDQQTSEE